MTDVARAKTKATAKPPAPKADKVDEVASGSALVPEPRQSRATKAIEPAEVVKPPRPRPAKVTPAKVTPVKAAKAAPAKAATPKARKAAPAKVAPVKAAPAKPATPKPRKAAPATAETTVPKPRLPHATQAAEPTVVPEPREAPHPTVVEPPHIELATEPLLEPVVMPTPREARADRVATDQPIHEPINKAIETTVEDSADAGPAPTRRRNRVARVAWYSTVTLLVSFLVVAAIWTITGGRSYVVTTPSMSPTVPVGSLVLTRPVPAGGPHVGQIIAFHPPNEPKTTYTHRVVKILPGPTYATKGDLDATPDAWVLMPKDILGVATHHYQRLGWLVRALPWLALGSILLMGLATFVPRSRRRVAYFVGGTVVLSVPVLVLRPLVRGVFAGSGLIHGRIHAMVVNTGLLPLRLVMKGATTQRVASGYPKTLIAKPPASGRVLITGSVDLSFWGWVVLVLICLAPLLIALAVPRKYWDGDDVVPIAEPAEELVPDPV